MAQSSLDLDRLLKLRFIVARYGEMDIAKWWNTRGQLGRLGAAATRRGFPRTHSFAQGRSVCAVADHRCRELFDPPDSVTLWRLTEAIEEEFESKWEQWLDRADSWIPFFKKLETVQEGDLNTVLQAFDVVTNQEVEMFSRLRRAAGGRAVPMPDQFSSTNHEVALLALGFARGETGSLVVPYASRGSA